MRKEKMLPALISLLMVVVISGAFGAGCGTTKKPQLDNLDPSSGTAGTKINIVGSNLGDSQGNSVVHVGVKVANVVSWSDTIVVAEVPTDITSTVQPVSILTGGGESDELPFLVIPTTPSPPDRQPGQAEHITPIKAMQVFEQKNGVSTAGWSYSVVKLSFLLKKVDGNWTAVDAGTAMTPQELQGDGAPSDLWVQLPSSQPQPVSEIQTILNYLKGKGIDTTAVTISFIKQSTLDPTWELFNADWPAQAQIPDAEVVLHQENGQWVVKNYGADVSNTPGMPADLLK
jgi:hypothetical protein